MMPSLPTVERADVTFCYEVDTERADTGGFVQVTRPLPWARVRIGSADYVAPVAALGVEPLIRRQEVMPFRAFPLEGGRAASVNSSDDAGRPGPIALHFFSGGSEASGLRSPTAGA